MSRRIGDKLDRVRLLLGDQNNELFTDEELLEEAYALLEEWAYELGYYRIEEGILIREGANVYQFPENFIKLRQMNIDDSLVGRIVISTSYQNIVSSGHYPTNTTNTSSTYWHFPYSPVNSLISKFYYRDSVSMNEFQIIPAFSADENIVINGEVFFGV